MTEQAAELSYFFCFRLINPRGNWVVLGPYDTIEQGMVEREKTKASHAEVTAPFAARSRGEAMLVCDVALGDSE